MEKALLGPTRYTSLGDGTCIIPCLPIPKYQQWHLDVWSNIQELCKKNSKGFPLQFMPDCRWRQWNAGWVSFLLQIVYQICNCCNFFYVTKIHLVTNTYFILVNLMVLFNNKMILILNSFYVQLGSFHHTWHFHFYLLKYFEDDPSVEKSWKQNLFTADQWESTKHGNTLRLVKISYLIPSTHCLQNTFYNSISLYWHGS